MGLIDELRGRTTAAVDAWRAAAVEPTGDDIPALLETLPEAGMAEAIARLELVDAWPIDRRIDEAIVGWIETMPFYGERSRLFWASVFARARRIRDPRLVRRIRDGMPPAFVRGKLRAYVANARREVIRTNIVDPEGPSPIPVPATDEDALLAAIHADPDDTAVRLVYADALIARGDPRGEFIALQCRGADAAAAALAKHHAKTWLGPLGSAVMTSFTFERGFLARCRVDVARQGKAAAVLGHPMWSTVRAFHGPMNIALHPGMRALRELVATNMPWPELLDGTTRRIEHLTYVAGRTIDTAERAALAACAALPTLRSVQLQASTSDFIAFCESPAAHRLEAIGLSPAYTTWDLAAPWVQAAIDACPAPIFQLGAMRIAGDHVTLSLHDAHHATAYVPLAPRTTNRVTLRICANNSIAARTKATTDVRAHFGDAVNLELVVIPVPHANAVAAGVAPFFG